MRVINRLLLLAVTAVVAVALAAPAFASAASWTTVELQEEAVSGFGGTISFKAEHNGTWLGMTCEIEGQISMEPGDSGVVEDIEGDSCSGTEALESWNGAGITVEGYEEPWGLKAEDEEVGLGDFAIYTNHGSLGQISLLSDAGITLTPNDPRSIGAFAISGTGLFDLNGVQLSAQVSGSFQMSDPGAYGISSADKWIDAKDPPALESPAAIEISGGEISWYWLGAGVECGDIHGEITLAPGGEAEIESLETAPGSCLGSGPFEGCQATSAWWDWSTQPMQLTEGGDLEAPSLAFLSDMCTVFEVFGEDVSLVADDLRSISEFTAEEPMTLFTGSGEAEAMIRINLELAPAGRYGIDP
jgi:hypothetical protein